MIKEEDLLEESSTVSLSVTSDLMSIIKVILRIILLKLNGYKIKDLGTLSLKLLIALREHGWH